jgi:hypothetical protein
VRPSARGCGQEKPGPHHDHPGHKPRYPILGEAAIGNAKRELIYDDIDHCLTGDGDARATVRELKQLTKFL